MMCCLVTVLLIFGSRLTILAWWIMDPARFDLAFRTWVIPDFYPIPTWIWALLGAIFLPWTTLAYVFVFPNGIAPYEWLILILAFLVDIAGHGGAYQNRGYYRR